MQVVIVVAHPKLDSLTRALATEFARGLTAAGHDYRLLDLYAEGFDPVLKPDELPGPGQAVPEEVRGMQARVRAADGLAFVYPLWWGAPPAILQGWLQRVLCEGFAFRLTADEAHGLLRHKAQIIVNLGGTTGGDPTAVLTEALQFCGMTAVQSLVNPGIGPGADPKTVESALKMAYAAGKAF